MSIRNAAIPATVCKDCWQRDKAQRALISLLLITSIILAGENDDVLESIDYGTIYKTVTDSMNGSKCLGNEVERILIRLRCTQKTRELIGGHPFDYLNTPLRIQGHLKKHKYFFCSYNYSITTLGAGQLKIFTI